MKRRFAAWTLFALLCAGPAVAEDTPGVTATEIRLGQTMSYSGVASAVAGPLGRAEQAYFRMINDQGGINGRKIVLESLDDGFDATKTLALTRKMVEQDHVAAIFSVFGTQANLAIRDYVNQHQVPDLFITSGDDWVIDRHKYPWTLGGVPVFRIEAQIFGRFILVNMPNAKVGLLRGRDSMGDSYRTGLSEGMGGSFFQFIGKDVVIDDQTASIDAAWRAMQAAGVNTVIVAAPPSIVVQAIARAHDGDWHPQIFINFAASSGSVLAMAGLEKSKGIITANAYADPTDPRWDGTDIVKPFQSFVEKYLPGEHADVGYSLAAYVSAQAMAKVLRQCGDDLTRRNIMIQATSLRDFHPVGLIPGITYFTSRTKYLPIVEAALTRFDGQHWVQFGDVMAGFQDKAR